MNHAEHYHQAPQAFNRAFAIGIGLNLLYVAVEAFYGWRVDSLALLADAGHNLSDVGGLALAWGATLAGRLRANARHTYGWRRASILAAFANATVLLVAMGSLLWEAVHRLQAPAPTAGVTIMVIAAIGVVVNGITAALFMSGRKSDLNLRGAFLHMAADALVSLGVVAAGALYLWTAWSWLDPATSMVIALVIVIGTWGLFRQSLHLLFDGVPEQVDLPAVAAWLRERPGVTDIHDLHIWAISTTETALSVHLVMPNGHPGDAFLSETATALHAHFDIDHPTMQIEIGRPEGGCAHPTTCPGLS
ncbi:cation diffusion facilitator family transporter [uncultured Thiocystis sp.]|uniref:cation diffusion facilitator family transporter n=1 Tax=uncultured Thiocystis sp. TaxID=1202134 RepID=UPI0025D777A4|nr:cation diffusion facilitator family transporter [uncultured Thiocystis sp.]